MFSKNDFEKIAKLIELFEIFECALIKSAHKKNISPLKKVLEKYKLKCIFSGISWEFENDYFEVRFSFDYYAFDFFHIRIKIGDFSVEKDISEKLPKNKYVKNLNKKFNILKECIK